MSQIETNKRKFLQQYNPYHDEGVALKSGINAAVQRNLLYATTINSAQKLKVRKGWAESLLNIGKEFESDVSIAKYEQLIISLQKHMNDKYRESFNSGSQHGSMFRISHSQKSISVYVKHLWCLNKIPEPRICPVDRIILNQTDAVNARDIAWGYVNSIEEHRRKFSYILEEAKRSNLSVARWELGTFLPIAQQTPRNQRPSPEDNDKRARKPKWKNLL